jgi:hypothetical protein
MLDFESPYFLDVGLTFYFKTQLGLGDEPQPQRENLSQDAFLSCFYFSQTSRRLLVSLKKIFSFQRPSRISNSEVRLCSFLVFFPGFWAVSPELGGSNPLPAIVL